jgi:hypothetical protein
MYQMMLETNQEKIIEDYTTSSIDDDAESHNSLCLELFNNYLKS